MPGRARALLLRWLLFCAISVPIHLCAQPSADTLYLGLTDCIRMGQQNGPNGEMARAAYGNKQHRYRAFLAGFLPQVALTGDAPQFIRTISSITQPDGSTTFQLQRQAQASLSLELQQRIALTGTEISLATSLNRLDNLETNASTYRSTPLTLSLRQPLFSINGIAWSNELEDLHYLAARRELAETMEDAAIDITNKFFGCYLASMNVNNARLNLAINDTLFQMSKGRFNVGKIAENDLLQSELAALNAQTQFDNARLDFARAAQALAFALGLPSETVIVPQPEEVHHFLQVETRRAREYARTYRSDYLSYQSQQLNAARSVRQAESDNSLSMSVSANIGLNQKGSVLDEVYRNLMDQQQFSVRFEVPLIGFGIGSHSVEAARAEQSRIETSVRSQQFTLEQEVEYQVRRFDQLQRQVALAAKADTVARRRFEVARERFIIGKIDIPNLFLAQSEKDNAYRARIQTLWDYWTTYYRLRRLTLFDFASNRPLVDPEQED